MKRNTAPTMGEVEDTCNLTSAATCCFQNISKISLPSLPLDIEDNTRRLGNIWTLNFMDVEQRKVGFALTSCVARRAEPKSGAIVKVFDCYRKPCEHRVAYKD